MPLVGRRGEMAVLEDELARAAAGDIAQVLLNDPFETSKVSFRGQTYCIEIWSIQSAPVPTNWTPNSM